MRSVGRIVILYPGEISPEQVSNPGNYALSRLLIELHKRGEPRIFLLNLSRRHEQYGNIEFVPLSRSRLLWLMGKCFGTRGTLIVCQTEALYRYAVLLRTVMPGSRVVVRLGGVYHGRDYLNSDAFASVTRKHRRRLAWADMIVSTADGTPVDLYMEKVGIPKDRYRKWPNGFPVIRNEDGVARKNRVLCISRLSAEKGMDYVIRSFAAAAPRLKELYELVIVGDGPERSNIERLARSLGVADKLKLVGVSYKVGPYLYSSRLLLNALANNTIMEAIATNTPVVTLDLGETRTLYGDFPNVHVISYPVGGYGRIADEVMAPIVVRTADAIVNILNRAPTAAHELDATENGRWSWNDRLGWELELYETLMSSAKTRA